MAVTLDAAVSAFGASLKAKLSNPAIKGAPEDQLRAPLETLIADLAEVVGLPAGAVGLGMLRRIAQTVEADQGAGVVRAALKAAGLTMLFNGQRSADLTTSEAG